MKLFSTILSILLFASLANSIKVVSMVSIINPISMHACLIKLHSIIFSAGENLSLMNFKFLLFDGLSVKVWDAAFCDCFCDKLAKSGSSFESKAWESKALLRKFITGSHKFNTERLFARFYLPLIFEDAERLFYIDNDAVVTADLSTFLTYSMSVKNAQTGVTSEAAVGLVFDKSIFNKFYMKSHFHPSHPLIHAAIARHGEKYYYNGGVMIIDTHRWRALNYTSRAEELFAENEKVKQESQDHRPLYDNAVGDQGVFYMMLEEVSYLDARFNMRRHPVKSVLMLQDNQTTGIVHFAGTDGGLESLCRYPALYPLYTQAAMPLYLSVYASLEKQCHIGSKMHTLIEQGEFGKSHKIPDMTLCGPTAVKTLQEELDRQKLHVAYHPGKARAFLWPPK